jgi:hypothetical protein
MFLDPDVIERYTDIFNIIFSYVIPFVKLYLIIYIPIYGVRILRDLSWLIHEIRWNAEHYRDNKGDD